MSKNTEDNRQFKYSLLLLNKYFENNLELKKILPLAIICKLYNNLPRKTLKQITARVIQEQKDDGAWTDLYESILSASFLLLVKDSVIINPIKQSQKNFLEYLCGYLKNRSAFGYSDRDRNRIPITSRILIYLAKIQWQKTDLNKTLKWLKNEWLLDYKNGIASCYKAADVLMANSIYHFLSQEYLSSALEFLIENRMSRGWGVRLKHPAGAIPSITGKVFFSLFPYRNYPNIPKNLFDISCLDKLLVDKEKYREHPQENALFWTGLVKVNKPGFQF